MLPIGAAPETDGTCTNHAGRVQRLSQAFSPPGEAKVGWEVLALLSTQLGGPDLVSISDVFGELTRTVSAFAGLTYGKIGFQGALLTDSEKPPTAA